MKPTHEEIEAAKAVLASAGYAVDSIWHVEDVNWVIENEDDPERYKDVSEEDRLSWLNSILENSTEEINNTLAFCIEDLLKS